MKQHFKRSMKFQHKILSRKLLQRFMLCFQTNEYTDFRTQCKRKHTIWLITIPYTLNISNSFTSDQSLHHSFSDILSLLSLGHYNTYTHLLAVSLKNKLKVSIGMNARSFTDLQLYIRFLYTIHRIHNS